MNETKATTKWNETIHNNNSNNKNNEKKSARLKNDFNRFNPSIDMRYCYCSHLFESVRQEVNVWILGQSIHTMRCDVRPRPSPLCFFSSVSFVQFLISTGSFIDFNNKFISEFCSSSSIYMNMPVCVWLREWCGDSTPLTTTKCVNSCLMPGQTKRERERKKAAHIVFCFPLCIGTTVFVSGFSVVAGVFFRLFAI